MKKFIPILILTGGATVVLGPNAVKSVFDTVHERVEHHLDGIESDEALIQNAQEGVDKLRADVAALESERNEIEARVAEHESKLKRANADVSFHAQEIAEHDSALVGERRFRVAGTSRVPSREQLAHSKAQHQSKLDAAQRRVKFHTLVLEEIADLPERSRERYDEAVDRLLEHEARAAAQGIQLQVARHDERAARVISADRPRTDATRSQLSDAMDELQRRIAEANAAWGASDPHPTGGFELVLDGGCLPMDVVVLER